MTKFHQKHTTSLKVRRTARTTAASECSGQPRCEHHSGVNVDAGSRYFTSTPDNQGGVTPHHRPMELVIINSKRVDVCMEFRQSKARSRERVNQILAPLEHDVHRRQTRSKTFSTARGQTKSERYGQPRQVPAQHGGAFSLGKPHSTLTQHLDSRCRCG